MQLAITASSLTTNKTGFSSSSEPSCLQNLIKRFSCRFATKRTIHPTVCNITSWVDFAGAEHTSRNVAVRHLAVFIFEPFLLALSFLVTFFISWKRHISTFLSISFVRDIKMYVYPSKAKKTSFALFFTYIHCVLTFLIERLCDRDTFWDKVNNVFPQRSGIL